MQVRLRRFRPQYSLRLALVCMVVIAALVAWRRDPLRRGLLALLARTREPDTHIVIVGPQSPGIAVALDPPSPDEIIRALEAAGVGIEREKNIRMVIEPVSDYVDPPKLSTASGWSRLHHAQYKCTIYSDSGARTVYLDHKHLCVP